MLKIYFRPKINVCNSNFTYKIQISYFRPMSLMALIMYNFKKRPGSKFRENIKSFRLKNYSFLSFWAKQELTQKSITFSFIYLEKPVIMSNFLKKGINRFKEMFKRINFGPKTNR